MMTWRVHACALDRRCRRYGAGGRVTVITPWGSLIVALRRRDRAQSRRTGQFRSITWHPDIEESA